MGYVKRLWKMLNCEHKWEVNGRGKQNGTTTTMYKCYKCGKNAKTVVKDKPVE